MTHPDRAIEAAEEAAFGEMDDRGLFKDVGEDLFDEIKRDVTAAVIAAYEAQRAAEGLVVVPKEPTQAMIEAGATTIQRLGTKVPTSGSRQMLRTTFTAP